VLFLPPGMKHRYKPVFETGWHEYWVGFKGEFFIKLLEERILPRNRVFFELGLHNSIISLYEQILDEVKAQQPLYQLKACTAALSLLAEILSLERRRGQPTHYQKIVEKAKFLIESGALSTINLSDISEHLGVSTSQLNEIFKTYTSMTPYQYFIHIKIHKAETLLEQTDTPVKEVAYTLGFEDPCYFSRLFKSKTGVTPSQWKKFLAGKSG
jgi:AraC-like DNA-binding protein